jgi:UDP-N-acetylmuramate: L-alanyl-gamma-D-glutamyl-meso-diaminopimelate ligase
LREILPVAWTRCLSFGEGAGCDFVLSRPAPGRIEIESRVEDVPGATVLASLPGAFNARNLAGAVLGARLLAPGLAAERTVDLSAFAGLKRRQEILFRDDRRILVEDFGHHPTALAATIGAFRESYPGWTVHAMVEPRSNTLRTNRLRGELVEALAGADRVTLAPVHRAGKLAESERLDPAAVAEVLSGRGVPSRSCGAMEEIPDAFGEGLEAGERVVTLLFSNGDFGGWIPRLRRLVAEG